MEHRLPEYQSERYGQWVETLTAKQFETYLRAHPHRQDDIKVLREMCNTEGAAQALGMEEWPLLEHIVTAIKTDDFAAITHPYLVDKITLWLVPSWYAQDRIAYLKNTRQYPHDWAQDTDTEQSAEMLREAAVALPTETADLPPPPKVPPAPAASQCNDLPGTNAIDVTLAKMAQLTFACDPIITANGEQCLALTDFSTPTLFLQPFRWVRTYRSSQCDQDIGLGYGWRSNFHIELNTTTDYYHKNLIVTDEEGRRIPFTPIAIGAACAQTQENLTLHHTSEDCYLLYRSDGTVYTFKHLHQRWRLSEKQQPDGRKQQFSYNAAGRLTRVLYHTTRGVELLYDRQNHLHQIRPVIMTTNGAQVLPQILAEYLYNTEHDLTQARNSTNQTEKYGYIAHLFRFRKRRTGYYHRFVWEGNGPNAKCIKVWGLDGAYDTALVYHPKQRLAIVTDGLGGATHYYHDALGRVIRTITTNGGEWKNIYKNNHLIETITPSGARKQWRYTDNLLTQARDANGHSRSYTDEDQCLIVCDEQGQEWVYHSNDDGLLQHIITPDGAITSIEYNAAKLPCKIHLPGRPVITLIWSNSGQLTCLQQDQASTEYRYDAQTGYLRSILDPAGLITEFDRNEHSQIIATRQYPQGKPDVRREYGFVYTAGRLTSIVDPLGRKTFYHHSNFKQIVQVMHPDQSTLTYHRDHERNPTAITRSSHAEFQMVYDQEENLIETIGFDGRTQQRTYDIDNQLQTVIDANERKLQVKRDDKGRILEQIAEFDNNRQTNRFVWDNTDKLIQADNEHCHIKIDHHSNGLPESFEQNDWRFAKQYDEAARVIELWLPDGDVIGFDYDDLGLSQIRWNEKPVLILHRNAQGQETLREQANGVVLQQAWYPFGELAAQQWQHNNLEMNHVRAYYFDRLRLIKIGDNEHGETHYRFDDIDQLLAVSGLHPETFVWDSFGNTQNDNIGVFKDQLMIKGDKRYQHDGSGNQIAVEQESPVSNLFEPLQQREFDGFNQLMRFSDRQNTTVYHYDALMRRCTKINQHGRTDFLWDGDHLIGQCQDGTFTWWVYQPSTFTPLLMMQNGKTYYYHTDHLGTPLKLTDENAQVVWKATYSAFGKATILVEKVKQPLRFPGQYYDEESALHYNRFRYYDPELGRYISQDPIGLAGGINPYQYAPNPIGYIDPLGLRCKETRQANHPIDLTQQLHIVLSAHTERDLVDNLDGDETHPHTLLQQQTAQQPWFAPLQKIQPANIGSEQMRTAVQITEQFTQADQVQPNATEQLADATGLHAHAKLAAVIVAMTTAIANRRQPQIQ